MSFLSFKKLKKLKQNLLLYDNHHYNLKQSRLKKSVASTRNMLRFYRFISADVVVFVSCRRQSKESRGKSVIVTYVPKQRYCDICPEKALLWHVPKKRYCVFSLILLLLLLLLLLLIRRRRRLLQLLLLLLLLCYSYCYYDQRMWERVSHILCYYYFTVSRLNYRSAVD